MKTAPLLVSLVAAATLACMHGGATSHGAQAATASAPASKADRPGLAGRCPMDVPGTTISATDAPDGEALTFTTTTADQVPALRERVRAMAEMHNQHRAGGAAGGMHHGHGAGMMGGGHGMHGGGEMGGMMMPPPSRAVVEDVGGGARIVVTPLDPADLQKLQSTVRMHAQHMQQHGCGMMDTGPAQQH